jgi:hypothetical protein
VSFYRCLWLYSFSRKYQSGRFCDSAHFDTSCANSQSFGRAFNNSPHPFEVGVETSLLPILGVADVVAYHRAFSA